MDKGKSKTDLRAAGKKRLEEYRQKRQQKGSSTKPSSTTALKVLTQSEQNVGENAVEEISRRASLLKAQRSSSQKDEEVELVTDDVHGDALEERHEVDVVFDASPGSSVTSSVQRLKVGGGHLTPETSEQSVESLREPGSSNGNLDDEDREAVYTILWEDHGTEHCQRNGEWQESTFDGGVSLNERRLHQGNCSSFWVDNDSYRSESKEGPSTQRKLSGKSVGAADKFQSSEEWDEPSLSLVLSEQGPMHDAEAEESRKHVLPVDLGYLGHSSFSNEESIEERMLLRRNKKLEKENAEMFSLRQIGLGRCPSWLCEIKLQVDSEVNPTLSNSFSESELGEKLQSVQGMLQARDMELIDAITKLEGATRVISEQEEVAKSYVQQNERLKEELTKSYEDLGMLKSNVKMAEQNMIGLKNELHEVIDSFNSIPEERNSQTEGVTLSMNEMVAEVNSIAKAIVEQAHRREMELQSANETAMAALLLESNTSKDLLTKLEREFRDSRNAAQDISWLYGASPPQSSLHDWATWLIDTLQNEHRKFEHQFQVTESMTMAANANTLNVQHLQEKIDSLYVELSNERNENEAVAEDLRSRDLELQIVRNKLQEQVENNLALESAVESAKRMCRVESALMGIEDVVGDLRFQGRPPSTASPTEWISWLTEILREVSEELKTSESACDVLSLQVEEAKNNYSSLYEELLSRKNENENLQSKQRAVHEMFDAERDSLKAEIQVLKDSSMETSRRESEFSEALNAVTNLQESLASKDRELSELHLRSAQQDSSIQSLMEERERLSSEEVRAQKLLQEKIDSLNGELSNQRNENEAVAEDLRSRDLELQIVRNKLQEQVENNLALESAVESAKRMCRVESALMGIEDVVGDLRFQGRPPSTSSPTEWISWLTEILREVSEELKTSESACDVLSLQVEEAKNNYSSLYEELLSRKNENENLQSKQRAVHEMFDAERDSLKAEIQVLKDSSMETSRRESEFSEALNAVTNLQESLASKDRELSELHAEIDALSLRSAQQDSSIQSLMEERERLSSEVVDGKAQCNLLQAEMTQTANEKSDLQLDINQLEQKLGAVREKLNLAINKGKGLVKQRDSLKKSLAEETAKVETMVSSYANDIQSKDSELLEIRAQAESMGTRVQELQAEVSSLFENATAYQQNLEAERRRLDSVFCGIEISKDLLPRDSVEKVKWLVSELEGTRSTSKILEGELGSSRNALETLKAVLRDTEERLQYVTVESLRAQEDISIYVRKMEEVESRATFDRTQYKNDVDELNRALEEADLRQQAAWSRVKEFERTVEKQQNTINASEAAHSKAVTKLSFTRNKLNLLVQDSQELVRECESLHKSLQERDSEIVELNHEVDKLKNVIHIEQSQRMDTSSKTSLQLTLLQEELARTNEKSTATVKDLRERLVALQCLLKEKDSGLEGVRTKLEDILLKGDNVLWMEHNIVHQNKGDDGVADIDVQSMNGSLDFTSAFTTLEERFNNLVAEAELHRNSSDKKEAQIQKLKKELHDISIERTTLQAGVQSKTMEVERLQSEVNSKGAPVECNISAESEIEELGTRSTWAGTGNPITPHVRGPRRHSQADIAIDMVDVNKSSLLSDVNDKEHGFSALTNSRLVPKAARILADRLDGLWFVGGRILTRQPSARLGLAMYWIFLHVYVTMIFSRGIL